MEKQLKKKKKNDRSEISAESITSTVINTKCWHRFACPTGVLYVASLSGSTIQFLCVECKLTRNAFLSVT